MGRRLAGAVTENQSPPCGFLVLSGPDVERDQPNPSHLDSANPKGQVLLDRVRHGVTRTMISKRMQIRLAKLPVRTW